jgi:hypothetical protein
LRALPCDGLLLEAYGFSVFDEIALWAAIAAFALATLMALLVLMGWRHARRVAESTEHIPTRSEPRGRELTVA